MPTPFEQSVPTGGQTTDWAASTDRPRRSVFGNYQPSDAAIPPLTEVKQASGCGQECLQSSIDIAIARGFLYQFLAAAFADPALETWTWLSDRTTQAAVASAVALLRSSRTDGPELSAQGLLATLTPEGFDSFQLAYVAAFGHAARGDCPLNEIEYGNLKADGLIQPHRLADLAGFYRAFGLQVADGAAERPDHIGMELEFMSVLAAKEAYAFEHQLDQAELTLCREAQRKFLREHLGAWALAFARRLARTAAHKCLVALADFTRDFLAVECAKFAVTPGSEDLLLRPVDEAAESLCTSCGLKDLPPGANSVEASP